MGVGIDTNETKRNDLVRGGVLIVHEYVGNSSVNGGL